MISKRITDVLPIEVVRIHIEAFQGFFLTTLGFKFLKTYYESLLKTTNGVIVCQYNEENEIVGFAVGTLNSKGFHKRVFLENKFEFIKALFFKSLSNPLILLRLFKNLNKKGAINHDEGNYAELLSIGIYPKYRGAGYGKLLLDAFEREIIGNNIKTITLTTDYFDNDNIIAFYKKVGYKIYYDFITYPNRRMYKLIKNL